MNQPAHHCAECAVRAHCEFTFGKFYADKSRGGVGCNYPLSAPTQIRKQPKRAKGEEKDVPIQDTFAWS